MRALRYVPAAVGSAGARMLNLYRKRGCSSLLTGNAEFAAEFARGEWFELDGQIPVSVEPLDQAAERFGISDAHFLKIDIQGAELEALQSAPKLVGDSLLAIQCEVEFAPLYVDQPLFGDIDRDLRAKGFIFAGFPALFPWRRGSQTKPDRTAPGPVPRSEAQLIHGDALFFRMPDTWPTESAAERDRLIYSALLAYAFGHADLSATTFAHAPVAARLREAHSLEADDLVRELGAAYAERHRRKTRHAAFRKLRDALR
jgi:FkbM family methyltransferase